jgi:hypothetical protein
MITSATIVNRDLATWRTALPSSLETDMMLQDRIQLWEKKPASTHQLGVLGQL